MYTNRGTWQPGKGRAASVHSDRATESVLGGPSLLLLQRKYRAALSGAVVAKARYLSQVGEAFASAISLERARWRWQRMEACRTRLAQQISQSKINLESTDRPVQRELRV